MNVLKSLQVICKKSFQTGSLCKKSRICKTGPIRRKIIKLSIFFCNGLDPKIGAFNEYILLVGIFQGWK